MLKGINEKLNKIFSGGNLISWSQRLEATNMDIETCNGLANYDSKSGCCELCVGANRIVLNTTNHLSKIHLYCRGVNIPYLKNDNVGLIFDIRKISNYLFRDVNKSKMMKSMGYVFDDYGDLYDILSEKVIDAFEKSMYNIGNVTSSGVHLSVYIIIDGKRDHVGEQFFCHVGCVAYPEKRLKVVTPLILDMKVG